MRDRREPPIRKAARVVAILAAASILQAAQALAQVSPGPLARPHRELEGSLNCFKCHGTSKDAMPGKCLECHTEIAWLAERDRGLHGQAGGGRCATCHPDHAGEGFELIHWEEGSAAKFDHRRAGWPLTGKHATLDCRKCHQEKYQISEAAKLGPSKGNHDRWTGLETECRACHEDVHRGALGNDCAKCHGTEAFKPAAGFDHAKTDFPLLGKHAPLACAACHEAAQLDLKRDASGKRIPLYKPLPHNECSACHRDPHEARLGADCSRCHTPEDWHRVAQTGFDHGKTRYPLRGAHAGVSCAKCHDAKSAWGPRPAFATCGGCHLDPHAGKATLAGAKVDCASCHDTAGWRPSTYTIVQHASSAYPLEGKHRQVACASCHTKETSPAAAASKPAPASVRIRPSHSRCGDCHRDAHGGQLASRSDRGACESCHDVKGWKPSLFTVADHGTLDLPLEGRHAAAACGACHGPDRKGLAPLPARTDPGKARVVFAVETRCADCHRDPHSGAFSASAKRKSSIECSACHDVRAFRPSGVDAASHARFTYPLDGAHRAVPCDVCHKELRSPPAASSLRLASGGGRPLEFSQKRSRCAECHETPHGDQFASRNDGECAACHGIERFRPADRFDHDRDAAFKLEGAHQRVACARCHASAVGAKGRPVIVYRGVSTRCESCHRGGTPRFSPASSAGKESGKGS